MYKILKQEYAITDNNIEILEKLLSEGWELRCVASPSKFDDNYYYYFYKK